MLAIGRALLTNPQLMILDEATEGLAPLGRRRDLARDRAGAHHRHQHADRRPQPPRRARAHRPRGAASKRAWSSPRAGVERARERQRCAHSLSRCLNHRPRRGIEHAAAALCRLLVWITTTSAERATDDSRNRRHPHRCGQAGRVRRRDPARASRRSSRRPRAFAATSINKGVESPERLHPDDLLGHARNHTVDFREGLLFPNGVRSSGRSSRCRRRSKHFTLVAKSA